MRTLFFTILTFITITAFMPIEKKRVIFFGDSITQAGVQPGGYITRIKDILTKENSADKFELIGSGIGGNKVYDLYLRLEDDVLSKKPDIVFIYIGVNDVWHKRTAQAPTSTSSKNSIMHSSKKFRHKAQRSFSAHQPLSVNVQTSAMSLTEI